MGLKTTDYVVQSTGITLPEAYAVVGDIYVDKSGNAKAIFDIQQDRDNAFSLAPVERVEVNFTADKDSPLHEQAYINGKSHTFADWEDDIITEESEDGADG